jgi:hypothetical protein
MSTPTGDPGEVEEFAAALESIVQGSDQWTVVASAGAVTLTRGWADGSVDTVVVAGPRAAYAFRENPGGREVWTIEGTVDAVAAAIRKLPAPLEPGAPGGFDHTPGPAGAWT